MSGSQGATSQFKTVNVISAEEYKTLLPQSNDVGGEEEQIVPPPPPPPPTASTPQNITGKHSLQIPPLAMMSLLSADAFTAKEDNIHHPNTEPG